MTAGIGFGAGFAVAALTRQFRPADKSARAPIDPLYSVEDPQFMRTMGSLLQVPILPGNRVTTLVNGDRIFPEMLAAVRSAGRTITMETFIYWSGETGREFAAALCDRARAGVRCHVLLDWLGSNKLDHELLKCMADAGVEIDRFHRPWGGLERANNRTHRKLLIVDGKVGFTGGVGIADEWTGDARNPDEWRDNHFKVEGPVVAQLQSAFTDNWLKSQHVVLHGGEYFPALEEAGPLRCQVFQSSPSEGSESMRLMFLLAIAAARKSIHIGTAYFVPDGVAVEALIQASRRGVDVQIIVPGPHIDTALVRHASRAQWGELLRHGVRMHEFMPTMYHNKVMIVDGLWTSIGSTNFDNRSFRLNDEANLNVYDADFAREQIDLFHRDAERCRPITYEQWRRRPLAERMLDRGAGLVSRQL